jgi:2,4-dienoyl-CoA reductase-like NADH-dependent reductase (Old Yellow Enzyme family)
VRELFEETAIGTIPIRNRLVRSATWEGLADPEGTVTPDLLRIYEELAEGGVGLIISSYLYVQTVGKQTPGQIGVHTDIMVPGLASLAQAVHDRGGKLVGQIVHCGGQATRELNGDLQPLAPSAVASPGYAEIPRAITADEIDGLVADFAAAALRLQRAGFDGVQLHGAHGYLLAQFLSPLRNTRPDEYGGDLANRARFCREVYRAVRNAVGADFPVMIKLNASDFLDGSTTEVDASYLASALAGDGIDCIEVSGGTPGSGELGAARPKIERPEDEAYFLEQAKIIRSAAPGVPLMLVGGLRSPEIMDSILEAGVVDFFSMSRPLIREPDLPNRWRRGDLGRAACVSCLGCFVPARKGEGIRCVQVRPEKVI